MPIRILLVLCLVPVLQACAPHRIAETPDPAATASPHCMQETGSRIPRKQGECIAAPGRSYSREDLERTGQANTGDAVRRVSP